MTTTKPPRGTGRLRKRLLRVGEAAAYFGVSIHVFEGLIAAGVVHPIMLPGQKQRRFDREELEALIEASRTRPGGMPESMPGKAGNFADFMKRLRDQDNGSH